MPVPDPMPLEEVDAAEVDVGDLREGELIRARGSATLAWPAVALRHCVLALVDVAEAGLARARLVDVRLEEPTVADLRAQDSTWRTVRVDGGRLGACDAAGATWDAVTVTGTRIGYLSLRDARLADVTLTDCRIDTLDLAGARLRRVSLRGCTIDELLVTHAVMDAVDLRGAHIARIDGVQALAGAVISPEQLGQVAADLAAACGIAVQVEPELDAPR